MRRLRNCSNLRREPWRRAFDELGISSMEALPGFMPAAETALQLCRRHASAATLLFFDLDGFKQINDQHGHHEGDLALLAFSQLLKGAARSTDVVARLGGDEFAVLANSHTVTHTALPLIARLSAAVTAHNASHGKPYALRYSVGTVSISVGAQPSVAQLLTDADERMYANKAACKHA